MTKVSAGSASETVVFAGPSCPPSMRRQYSSLSWRDPVVAGDMLRLLSDPPKCVVIIDGLFDQRPAVRHKEILLLLSQGVHVLGGASMGALRAAELSAFGMVGVGQIYRAYSDGRLTGDDEVALLHGPGEFDWTPLTVPLVNVRATLVAATRARVLPVGAARRMLQVSAAIFYQHRTWEGLTSAWIDDGRLAPPPNAFLQWLTAGVVDIKRLDAADCIHTAIRIAPQPASATPPPPDTLFTRALSRSALGDGVADENRV